MNDTDAIPVDAPGEPAVRSQSTVALWALVLAGPAVWMSHFVAVYLAAEASCTSTRTDRMDFIGSYGLEVVVFTATVIATTITVATGWLCRRRMRSDDFSDMYRAMYRVGALLSLLSLLSVLAVGGPALLLDPC